jgi:NAD(P) transhydrogenase subunit alpha
MKVGIPRERREGEMRVAGSPDMVKRLAALGVGTVVESGAGEESGVADDAFAEAGATIAENASAVYGEADVVLKVQRPLSGSEGGLDELAMLREGTILVGLLNPLAHPELASEYAARRLTVFAMELVPRISRAQSMDALSSQSNLAGYKAVIDAAAAFPRIFPMMMTAAGTIAPARVLVLGAGVAGLQAIATARRLGAVVTASDVRPVVKTEVESLGATFLEVESDEDAQTEGGYAKEMSEDYMRRQREAVHQAMKKHDVVITTALIPGRPAPILIPEEMVRDMKPGSVIVDMAAPAGGNCALTEPGQRVVKHGVLILGPTDLASEVPVDTSALYARNLWNFLELIIDGESKALAIDWEDEIVKSMLVTRDGEIVHPALRSQ